MFSYFVPSLQISFDESFVFPYSIRAILLRLKMLTPELGIIFGAVVGIVNGIRAGRSGIRIPPGVRDLFILQILETGCGAHSASYSEGTVIKRRG